MRPTCCWLNQETMQPCGKAAEWAIWADVPYPDGDYTEACTAHVGELLGDEGLYHVYPIKGTAEPGPRRAAVSTVRRVPWRECRRPTEGA